MQYFQSCLSDEEVNFLKKLLGKPTPRLLSSGIEVKYPFIRASDFSMALEHNSEEGYLVIENFWLETPEEYLDYYKLSVAISDSPMGILTSSQARAPGKPHIIYLNGSYSSITPARYEYITKICIFEASDESDDGAEAICYDRAIVFYGANAPLFSLSTADGIADLLEFTESIEEIEAFVQSCRCRLCLVN